MKVIPKFQQGGGFAPFFTLYTSVEGSLLKSSPKSSGSSSEPKEPKKSSDGLLTLKDFFNMLKDIDGLPNEMNVIISGLIRDFQLLSLTGIPTEDLAVLYLSTLNKIKVAAQNKKTFDTLYLNALNESTLHEPAITPAGNLFVLDRETGKPVEVTLQEFLKNYKKYSILTNSNVAFFRSQAKAFAYDPNRLFDVISNGVSAETFQKALNTILVSLGHNKELIGLAYDEALAAEGAKVLLSMNPEERDEALNLIRNSGYKYNISTNSNEKLIMSLITYMNTVLPKRFKVWASVKTGIKDSNEASKALITEYLSSRGVSETSKITSFDKDPQPKGKQGSKGKESSADSDAKMTFLNALQNGLMGREERRIFNPGTTANFSVSGKAYGAAMGIDGKVISNSTLLDLLTQSGLSGIINPNSITFGNNVINANVLPFIAVENTGGFRAILPSINTGTKIIPNFDLITKFSELVNKINIDYPNYDADEREKVLKLQIEKTPELQELLDVSGELDTNKFSVFYIVDGLASSDNFEFTNPDGSELDSSSPFIKETTNKTDLDYFKKVTLNEELDIYDGWIDDLFPYNKIYKGNIFIPIQNNNRLAATIFSGLKVKESTGMEQEQEYLRYNLLTFQLSNSEYLYK